MFYMLIAQLRLLAVIFRIEYSGLLTYFYDFISQNWQSNENAMILVTGTDRLINAISLLTAYTKLDYEIILHILYKDFIEVRNCLDVMIYDLLEGTSNSYWKFKVTINLNDCSFCKGESKTKLEKSINNIFILL